MSWRRLKDEPQATIYGEVRCKGVTLNRRQRNRVEKEVLALIRAKSAVSDGQPIQYSVAFEKGESEPLIRCSVGIISRAGVWEDAQRSPEPFKAFRRCLECLNAA